MHRKEMFICSSKDYGGHGGQLRLALPSSCSEQIDTSMKICFFMTFLILSCGESSHTTLVFLCTKIRSHRPLAGLPFLENLAGSSDWQGKVTTTYHMIPHALNHLRNSLRQISP